MNSPANKKTQCRVLTLTIPTYPEPEPERMPMYCETRAHQLTSGQVYPNAVINHVVRDRKMDKAYTAVVLENDWIELTVLPEIGGRIFSAKDKSNGYDFFYRQHVIKPALIGLLGSWISGGVEFNWPLHHRPSTFMATDFSIEESADGSVTVWLSEHEPLDRMKGMVGICVYPDKAMFETKVRLYNRTPFAQSFLWWENAAVAVNKDYQIFFPPDVNHVHFHYKQSVTEFPIARSMFNGIDYGSENKDIRWHKNTLKPTSYFSARSNYDFFGGFDHGQNAGVVHIANHHIAPGKKLFTWAYNQLSKSWETALTDTDGPYAELMAGSYSDNQPDFSWIEPYEVKEFSHYWYPIKEIGEPLNATTAAALSCRMDGGRAVLLLYAVSRIQSARLTIAYQNKMIHSAAVNAEAGTVSQVSCKTENCKVEDLVITVTAEDGRCIISYRKTLPIFVEIPSPMPGLPAPQALDNAEELYLAGLHVRQYRDALIHSEAYWTRAAAIDPGHYRSYNELGLSALKEARLADAESHFRKAITVLTRFNPNPSDGEVYYNLGLALKYQGDRDGAYDAFYKSVWNYQWRSAGYYALAQIDCLRGDYRTAKEHLLLSLKTNSDHSQAANLLACVERRLGNEDAAQGIVDGVLAADPLDYWALNEMSNAGGGRGKMFELMHSEPSQTVLDITFEYTGSGLFSDAATLLGDFIAFRTGKKISPMVYYVYGWVLRQLGQAALAEDAYRLGETQEPDYCFPSRLEEMLVLQEAAGRNDSRAAYYLGNLLYGKKQYEAAIASWEKALDGGEKYYVLLRNLGMGYYNQRREGVKALDMLRRALECRPDDPQLIFELCQLMQKLNRSFAERLELLRQHMAQVEQYDNLYMEYVLVHNQLGHCEEAIRLLKSHTFTPCEGGEHALIELWIFAHFKLGREAMARGDNKKAADFFQAGQVFPDNLGAGIWNIVMNVPCMYYEAKCLDRIEPQKALDLYRFIADMRVDVFATMYQPGIDYYRALAWEQLGNPDKAEKILNSAIAQWQEEQSARDYGYFKSTPFFLSYLENPADARRQHYDYLLGLGYLGLGDKRTARDYFLSVLKIHSGHMMADLERTLLE